MKILEKIKSWFKAEPIKTEVVKDLSQFIEVINNEPKTQTLGESIGGNYPNSASIYLNEKFEVRKQDDKGPEFLTIDIKCQIRHPLIPILADSILELVLAKVKEPIEPPALETLERQPISEKEFKIWENKVKV